MNRENLQALINHLRTVEDVEFDMSNWLYKRKDGCGTAGCVAGHAVLVAKRLGQLKELNVAALDDEDDEPEVITLNGSKPDAWDFAQEWLDLPTKVAASLFVSAKAMELSRTEMIDLLQQIHDDQTYPRWVAREY